MAKHHTMVIDLSRCIGCHTCTIACKMENNIIDGSWINIYTVGPFGSYPNVKVYYHPTLCNHCERPECIRVCQVGAITKRADGVVLVDSSLCSGCKECIAACPFHALRLNTKNDVVEKCTMCVSRVDEGLQPFCVVCCPMRALSFGDSNDSGSDVCKKSLSKNLFVAMPQYGTNPSVIYVT